MIGQAGGSIRWREIIERAAFGVAVIENDTNRIQMANRSFASMHGYEPSEMVGVDALSLYAGHDRQRMPQRLQKLEEVRHIVFQAEHLFRNGMPFPVLVDMTLIGEIDDGSRLRVKYCQDITELRIAQEELRRSYEEMERRVEQRTRDLAAVNADLEAFSYSVSHDLRAPLRAIRGYVDLLAHEGNGLSDEGRRLLGVITGQSEKLSVMIEGLLRFARVSRVAIERCQVDGEALVGDVVRSVAADYPGTEVAIGPIPPLWGDPLMLRQIVTNIISNAFKFSAGVEKPSVAIGAEQGSHSVVLCVRDNGPGFDQGDLPRLFEVFYRLEEHALIEGSGVGLAIVRRLVEKHGGRVWSESARGKGATFHVELPLPSQEHAIG